MLNSANCEDHHHQTLISNKRNKRPSRVPIGFLNATNVFAQGTRSQRRISALRPRNPLTLGVANAHLGANTLSLPNELTMKHEDSRHFLAIIPPEILLSAAVVG